MNALVLTAGVVALAAAPAGEWRAQEPRARALFATRCEICHGARGEGDGPAAHFLDPPPRNLASGVFRWRSTPTGELPTDEDLFRSITAGARGTSMPAWSALPVADRWLLVGYVKSLSPRFGSETPSRVLVPGPPPVPTPEAVARGRAAYAEVGCALCHGPEGRGDGSAAAEQKDDDGRPLLSPALTDRRRFRAGGGDLDLYRTLATGLDGSGMPSYGDALSPDQLWDLVVFVRSLSGDLQSTAR